MGNLSIPNDSLHSSIPIVQSNLTLAGKDGDFVIQGETSRCEAIIGQGKHALIGISPFNSRFSKAYVSSLVLFIAERFSQVDILMPCIEEASRLLIASGVDEKKAFKKTERELRHIFAELPFFLNTPSLLGVTRSTFFYHRPWPIGQGLYGGTYPIQVDSRQSYAVVTPKTEQFS
ncbi:hypothetical protein ATY35_14120 [Vibrio cidicii]|uniref:Cyclodipeptide synthase n=1 Tax=Vibrio cidicii TaxID=1763883 RepID=A0ABR5W3P5_9VIBR|nr:tRNA-dependent cyclodipeptide synthase [Vibrio cidicii]KYN86598.1 hypothetical protein ATY35_14120 [Vibrio cidicii]